MAGVLTGVSVALAAFGYIIWLGHLGTYCADARSGSCGQLDHPYGRLTELLLLLWLFAGAAVVIAGGRRPRLGSVFVWVVITLEVSWLIGFFPFRARYDHPHAGGRSCYDECLDSVFNYWGWVVLEFLFLPFIVGAFAILQSRLRSWVERVRL